MLQAVPQTDFPQARTVASELDEPIWSVISFARVERRDLKYSEAVLILSGLESRRVAGLCIVTNETADRVRTQE